jgi:hypothetical protein
VAYSVGFGKLEREVLSNDRLPTDVRLALVCFKQALRSRDHLQPFDNEGTVLPEALAGQTYYKFQVGEARSPTPEHPSLAGSRRLVALVDPCQRVLKIYFTDDHYRPGSWWQLQYP